MKQEMKLIKQDANPRPDPFDEELRRLVTALLTVYRRKYPNDFRQMLSKVNAGQKMAA